MFEEALKYPFNRDNAVKDLILGAAFQLFWWIFFVPQLLIFGYLLRALRESAEGYDEPPEFEDFGELLVDGIKVFVVGAVYMFVPTLVFGLTLVGSLLAIASETDTGVAVGFVGLLGGMLLGGLLSVVFGYFLPAALTHMAVEDRIGAAFSSEVLDVGFSSDYFVGWIIFFIVSFGLFSAVFFFWFFAFLIPIIGLLFLFLLIPINAFISFYVYVFGSRLFGRSYAEVLGDDTGTAT